MSATAPQMFQPFLTDFFVEAADPSYARRLKLEIMTNLANESNIDRILREFTWYSQQEDKEFVAATIQSIGKCAMRLSEVTERCMTQLLHLLSSKSEAVVAESVIVIKQLLQMPPPPKDEHEQNEHDEREEKENGSHHDDVIKRLTRMFDKVTNPKARASIIWVVGEYVDKIGPYAPDILRQLAKEFTKSSPLVKIQILNLAAKLMLTDSDHTALIVQYILTLAKYDVDFDIRDKSRLMRHILLNPLGKMNVLHGHAKQLFITKKPIPIVEAGSQENKRFMIGSLSHVVNHTVPGYQQIPDWAKEPADAELRQSLEPILPAVPIGAQGFGSGSYNPLGGPFGGGKPWEQQGGTTRPTSNWDEDLDGWLDNTGQNWDDENYDEGELGYYDEDGNYIEGGYAEGINEEGYYDEEGNYIEGGYAEGYYDEEGNYIEGGYEEEGYYDEEGNYIEGYGEDGEQDTGEYGVEEETGEQPRDTSDYASLDDDPQDNTNHNLNGSKQGTTDSSQSIQPDATQAQSLPQGTLVTSH